jgi:hypothetical protein
VQAASGIAVTEEDPSGVPGALPAQALDHGTGYLLATAVLRSLTEQQQGRAGSRVVRLALAQTAHWLLHGQPQSSRAATPDEPGAYDPADWLMETEGPLGRLRHARSPLSYEGGPTDWPHPPRNPGTDATEWR